METFKVELTKAQIENLINAIDCAGQEFGYGVEDAPTLEILHNALKETV